jgi:hypothetical protein
MGKWNEALQKKLSRTSNTVYEMIYLKEKEKLQKSDSIYLNF